MYNLRVKRYHDSIQLQHFEKPIVDNHTELNFETGEIKIHTRDDGSVLIENPFTGDVERVKQIPDSDKCERMAYNNYCRAKNQIYDIARCNIWEWFLTFTFSPEYTDRYDYTCCSKKLSDWIKNNKKRYCNDMKYLCVPEQHKDGAWHFHGLFSDCDGLCFVDSGKTDKKGRKIYNVGRYKWGFTTATKIDDSGASASYLCKYVTKELVGMTKGKKRYWASKNCDRPIIEDYILEGGLMSFLEQIEFKNIKRVQTPFNSVTYIEI